MSEKQTEPNKSFSADWFLRGALIKIGDTFDRFTGRKWVPSSSLATSELIERIKKLLDSEARDVPGKGKVVPHDIKLMVQWNKFSTEGEDIVERLENELLTATADHINDSLYYTFAPLAISVAPDYFVEGVRLTASFGKFDNKPAAAEMNVTLAGVDLAKTIVAIDTSKSLERTFHFIARFQIGDVKKETELRLKTGRGISVGRNASNELVLDENSISKIHASLSVDMDGHLLVADTGSTNGTFINDERIAYGKAVAISEGSDRVKFGSVEVTFERVAESVPDEVESDISQAATVEIDGLSFTSRASMDLAETKPPGDETETKHEVEEKQEGGPE